MSKRQDIAAAIENKLKEITVANGYNTDIGLHVLYYYGSINEFEGEDFVCFADKDEKYELVADEALQANLSIVIQAIRYGDQFGQLINETVQDILRAFGSYTNLGLTNVFMTAQDSLVDIDDSKQDVTVIQFNYNVAYIIE